MADYANDSNIIGFTTSGIPVYDCPTLLHFKLTTKQDYIDAAAIHCASDKGTQDIANSFIHLSQYTNV